MRLLISKAASFALQTVTRPGDTFNDNSTPGPRPDTVYIDIEPEVWERLQGFIDPATADHMTAASDAIIALVQNFGKPKN